MTRLVWLALLAGMSLLTLAPSTVISAAAGFYLLAYLPGRLLLRPIGLESATSSSANTLLAVALSWSVVPFVLNPVWHVTHDRLVTLACVLGATFVLIVLQKPSSDARLGDGALGGGDGPLFAGRTAKVAMLVIAVIVAASVILPYWPTELFGFPMPSQIHDFIKHHAILDSLERRPLPLGNVFYADGADQPVYYYHFFYLIPATVRLWNHHALELEAAFGIASALVAVATTGMVYIIAKRFGRGEGPALLAALLVTLVGALDIIPLVFHMVRIGQPVIVQDAWAMHQFRIHNTLNQMIWAPQHVTGVLAVLVAVDVLSRRGCWRGWLLLGPVLGAGVIGSSVWVAIGALSGLAVWACTLRRRLPAATLMVAVMFAIAWPSLAGYLESSARLGGGLTAHFPRNNHALFGRLLPPGLLANLLDLPWWLAIEFGARVLFLPLLPRDVWRRMWRDHGMRWLFCSAVVSLIAFCLVHSTVRYNAFSQRIVLLPMVFTSILIGCLVMPTLGRPRWFNPFGWRLVSRRRWARYAFGMVLVLGLPVGFWEAPAGAVRRYAQEAWAARRRSPEEASAIDAEHAAFAFMRHDLPAGAVVQPDPSPERAPLAQIIRRQLGVIGPQDDVLVFDPPDREAYLACFNEIANVLGESESAEDTYTMLKRHHVTHVLIGTVEHRRWQHLGRFDDARFFVEVFRRNCVRVIALTNTKTKSPG